MISSANEPLRPASLLDVLADGLDDTSIGALTTRPSVVLDLDADPTIDRASVDRLSAVLAGRPCVVIGVSRRPIDDAGLERLLDVALCDEDGPPAPWVACAEGARIVAGRLVAAVGASPGASTALAQLLRHGASCTPAEAVVAESFVYSLLQGGDRHREWLRSRVDLPRHPRPDGDVVLVERDGDHMTVVLDRPGVRNAYGTRMRDELVEALRLVAVDDTIASVTVRGNGPSFSSGGDLDEFGTAPAPLDAHLVRTTRNAGIELSLVADRVTFHVHGPCVGAGVELPAFASRVVAHPGTTFLLPEVAMGLVPGAGGTASIPRRIGRHRTAFLALLGAPIDAATALRWGLVDEVSEGGGGGLDG